ncbi:HesA/MoeB/ThiF family protein [Arenibacter sp. GZD96]|uniref:HesA/MoeB/ThiF family protein n=1 Tax=Aurantibrevibacter litoralis TaxID=3106030 RepID=UPI002AFEA860|nr:HesA/MoeB/ThiF family protein [Arenibacter sp. GZD-96]MEA1785345.1 HesA/MoeB/ThiF family protein [Arenibacter sp. GZD-96]
MKTNRYIRQTVLKEFGADAQHKLSESKVLVVGIGGLGIPVVQYLNAMGVGTLGLVEHDTIDITNLQRQVLYTEGDVGKSKLKVALSFLKAQNTTTIFKPYEVALTKENALDLIAEFDVVVDASDNFATRFLINDACVILKKPFVYGALHAFEGQVSVFNYKDGPTYRCLFPEMPTPNEIPNCNDNGVLGVIPGIIGNFQALEAVKVLTGVGEVLSGKLLLYNGLNQSIVKMSFPVKSENKTIKILRDFYEWGHCFTTQEIHAGDFQKEIHAGKSFQILDVRTPQEFDTFHLPNSINIPLNELERRVNEINFIEPIYAVCQSGIRSKAAAGALQKISERATIYNVVGGINKMTVTTA